MERKEGRKKGRNTLSLSLDKLETDLTAPHKKWGGRDKHGRKVKKRVRD